MEEIKRVQLSEVAELITKGTTPTTIGFEFQEQGVNFLKIECFDENGDAKPQDNGNQGITPILFLNAHDGKVFIGNVV